MQVTKYVFNFGPQKYSDKKKFNGTVKLVYNDRLGTQNLWPLLTGSRCSEVDLQYKDLNWYFKIVVDVGRWSLFGGGL
jgi:hypothetical protein